MRRHAALIAAGAAVALGVTGCSFDKSSSTTGGSTDEGQATGATGQVDVQPLEQIGWGGTSWTQNFNLFSPTGVSVTPGTAYVYEPLVRMDRSAAGEILPYLAESWEYNEDGTQLTFTLRDDVTWSDGEKFTADDVKFTWDLVLSGETPVVYPFESVEAPDEKTVVVTYKDQAYQDLAGFATRQIVPEHVWSEQNVREWTNPEPVGTGPLVLDKFSPQQISFTVREDWWGGESQGLQRLNLHAVSGDARMAQITSGEVDFGTFGWANAQEEFVAKNPDVNVYTFFPTGASDGIIFNVEQAPYDDPHVRRALRAAVDLEKAAEVVAVGYEVPTQAGLDPVVYGDQLAPDTEQAQDVEYAKSQLEEGGWTVEDGKLVKDGESFEIRYDVYQPYAEWVNTGTVLADMWQEGLGLEVKVNQMADAPFTEASTTGDFGMLSGSPTFGSTPYNLFSMYGPDNYVPVGEQAVVNQGRWQNDDYSDLLAELAAIEPGSDPERAKEISVELQTILAQEAPFIATATAGWKAVVNQTNWSQFPVKGDDYAPNPTLPADAPLTIMGIAPSS